MSQPIDTESIRIAGACIARAALFDDRIPDGDRARITAWAEALAPHKLDIADALAAVTRHYQSPGVPPIRPGEVITGARAIRAERGQRDNAEQIAAAAIAPPDAALGGLTIGGTNGEPVWRAYEETGALAVDCPTCEAPMEHACLNKITGGTRTIPCLARTRRGMAA